MSKIVEKAFFEFLFFPYMKMCLQCAVSKTWLYGVLISFDILEAVIL